MASSSSFLINDPKFSWLGKELELQEKNPGVFDGSWHASGKVLFVMFPNCSVTRLATLAFHHSSSCIKLSSLHCTGVPLVMSTSHPAYIVQVYQSVSPSSGLVIAEAQEGTIEEYRAAVERTRAAWGTWVEVGHYTTISCDQDQCLLI